MDRNSIADLLKEARKVTGDNDFVVLGSAAIQGKTTHPPRSMTSAANVNYHPLDRINDNARLWRTLGVGSEFHSRRHFYGSPTSPSAAALPEGWRQRLTRVDVAAGLRAWFVDANDMAVAKYVRGYERDRTWIRTGLEAGLLSLGTIKERFENTVLSPEDRARLSTGFLQDTIWMTTTRPSPPSPQAEIDQKARDKAVTLIDDIKTAAAHFKRYADRGQLKLANFYLTEYHRSVDRAARAAIEGNQHVVTASVGITDLRTAIDTMRHRDQVIATAPHLHLKIEGQRTDASHEQKDDAEGGKKSRRKLLDGKLDALEEFEDLYQDVTRTSQEVPVGALHRHALARLKQSFGVLLLVEKARDAGIIPRGSRFVATGAKVQDKTTSKEYPAAHRLPCDLSTKDFDGSLTRLSDFFNTPVNRLWIDKNLFAPTDKVHRLTNVADRWCEDGGMITALTEAANAVTQRSMSAESAMSEILEPGYAETIKNCLAKVERNFSFIERQELRRRVVDLDGKPFNPLPEPLVLHVKGLAERAVAKDLVEQTLHAYSAVTRLPPDVRMDTAMTVRAIVNNELQAVISSQRRSETLLSYQRIRHSDEAWPHVRQWLVDAKGFSSELIDGLRKADRIAADGDGNLVGRLYDRRGREAGAELVGTSLLQPSSKLAPGSRQDAGFMIESQPGSRYTSFLSYQEVAIVKDTMQALAYADIHRGQWQGPALVVSTNDAGLTLDNHIIGDLARQKDNQSGLFTRFAVAYDGTSSGDQASEAAARWLIDERNVSWAVRRERPSAGDWTQSLAKGSKDQAPSRPSPPSSNLTL